MFKICELWTVILWYELNPRVRCAFGNVIVIRCQSGDLRMSGFSRWVDSTSPVKIKKQMNKVEKKLFFHDNMKVSRLQVDHTLWRMDYFKIIMTQLETVPCILRTAQYDLIRASLVLNHLVQKSCTKSFDAGTVTIVQSLTKCFRAKKTWCCN